MYTKYVSYHFLHFKLIIYKNIIAILVDETKHNLNDYFPINYEVLIVYKY